jgi:glycosyltransferase involved in cell wall biosynthesis
MTPTGVGQHIIGMFSALQSREDVTFSLVAPLWKKDEGRNFISNYPRSRLMPVPWPDRLLRYATACASLVNLDRWVNDIDWVYVPVEQPVTTSRRLAVTIHDLYAFEPNVERLPENPPAGLGWRRRMARILDRADLIVTVSEFTRSRLLDLFDVRHAERIVVVGNGGAEGFSAAAEPGDDRVLHRYGLQRHRYVLFPASLTYKKGGDLLLQVATLAHAGHSGLNFVVIGRRHDARLLAALRDLKEQAPEIPVALLGYIARPELAALYRHARAAFLPSRY